MSVDTAILSLIDSLPAKALIEAWGMMFQPRPVGLGSVMNEDEVRFHSKWNEVFVEDDQEEDELVLEYEAIAPPVVPVPVVAVPLIIEDDEFSDAVTWCNGKRAYEELVASGVKRSKIDNAKFLLTGKEIRDLMSGNMKEAKVRKYPTRLALKKNSSDFVYLNLK